MLDVNIILFVYSNYRFFDVEERMVMCLLLVERFILKRDFFRVICFGLNLLFLKLSVIEFDMGLCLLMLILLLVLIWNWYVVFGVRLLMNVVFFVINGIVGIYMVILVFLNLIV